jgi:hypothetical protein
MADSLNEIELVDEMTPATANGYGSLLYLSSPSVSYLVG